MIGQFLLRILYRFVPSSYYSVAAQGLRGESRVLDVGSGRAPFYPVIGGNLEYYVAVDVDEKLLQMQGTQYNLELVVASGEYLPIRGRGWRGVIVFHDSLHHLPGPEKALVEAAETIAPGGRILVYDYDPSTLAGRLLVVLERLLGFPARFLEPSRAAKLLASRGLETIVEKSGTGYRLVAWRKHPGKEVGKRTGRRAPDGE